MASVNRIETTRGPRWELRWRGPDGREKSRRYKRFGTADAERKLVEQDTLDGINLDPSGRRVTFAQIAERWLAAADHTDSTAIRAAGDLRLHILPAIGAMRIQAITRLDLEALRRQLEARLAPATVSKVWAWVTAVFTAAVAANVLRPGRNPAAGMAASAYMRREPEPLVELQASHVEAVVAELPSHYRAVALCAVYAGLRHSEATGLVAARVGFQPARDRVNRVERQLISGEGRPPYLRLPKGGKKRVVPVADVLTDALAEHLARFGPGPSIPDQITGELAQLIFASGRGRPVIGQLLDQAFLRAVRRAGLPEGSRFHDLRHFYAASLIDRGCSEREIGARLGHSSAQVTARYGHLLERADDRARAAGEATMQAIAEAALRAGRGGA